MKQFLNKKTFLVATAALGLGIAGCKKSFLDINDNPNAVTEQNVTPELIFPAGASRAAAISSSATFLENWMGYFSTAGDYAIDQEETSYNLSTTFNSGQWTGRYDILFDLEQTRKKAVAEGDTVLAGAAIIISSKLWQELVDLYGNIPFTQALNIAQTSTPAYDKDSTVYRLLHANLDQAISYMHGTARPTYASVIGNIVHIGLNGSGTAISQANWIRFANTLKLRMLIRTSEVATPGINRTAELAKIVANGGVLQAGQSVLFNPGYANSTGKQTPFYAQYGFTPTNTDGNAIARANKYTVDTLSAKNDARLARLYRGAGVTSPTQTGGSVVGTRYGQATGNPFGNVSSKMGMGTTGTTAATDMWLFTSVESLFLQAEAIQRGWLTGTPATAYSTAVIESFRWLGVPGPVLSTSPADSTALAYIAANPYINPTSLAYQKYYAMNSIDPIEAYCDYRRLGVPANSASFLSANPSRHAGSKLPNRLLYPQEEYSLNFDNVNAQGDINKDNIFTTAKIFWQP